MRRMHLLSLLIGALAALGVWFACTPIAAQAQAMPDYEIRQLSASYDPANPYLFDARNVYVDATGAVYFNGYLEGGTARGVYRMVGASISPVAIISDVIELTHFSGVTEMIIVENASPLAVDSAGRVYLYFSRFENGTQVSAYVRIEADGAFLLLKRFAHSGQVLSGIFQILSDGSWIEYEWVEVNGVDIRRFAHSNGLGTSPLDFESVNTNVCNVGEQVSTYISALDFSAQAQGIYHKYENYRRYAYENCTRYEGPEIVTDTIGLIGDEPLAVIVNVRDTQNPPVWTSVVYGSAKINDAGQVVYAIKNETWPEFEAEFQLLRDNAVLHAFPDFPERSSPSELGEELADAILMPDGGVIYHVPPGALQGQAAGGLYRDGVLLLAGDDPRFPSSVTFDYLNQANQKGAFAVYWRTVEVDPVTNQYVTGNLLFTPGKRIGGVITRGGQPMVGIVVYSNAMTTTTDAEGEYTFAGLENGDYRIEPVDDDFDFTPRFVTITIGANVPGNNFTAVPAPDNFLRPQPDGLPFENWGGAKYPADGDLSIADLFSMFGSGVCQSGTTPLDCVLTAAAQKWRSGELVAAQGGHCAGMTSAALRFWTTDEAPASFLPGAAMPFNLNPTPPVTALVTRYHTLQSLDPLIGDDGWIARYGDGKTPNQVLELIRTNLADEMLDPLYLGFRMAGKGGHAVTPYKVSYKGKDTFHVYVYDSNWPGNEDRYLIFNSKANTWRYALGAVKPEVAPSPWFGDASTQTLRLRRASRIIPTGLVCPFCPPGGAVAAGDAASLLSISAQGALPLVKNGAGAVTGWQGSGYVNQIPDAEILHVDNGTEVEVSPTIVVSADSTYTIQLSNILTTVTDGGFTALGAGGGGGVEAMEMAAGESAQATVGESGQRVRLTSTSAAPTLFVLNDLGEASHHIEIQPESIAPGSAIELRFNTQNGTFTFGDNDPAANTYTLHIVRVTDAGEEQLYHSDPVTLPGTGAATANVAMWDGAGGLQINIGGAVQTIPNQGGFTNWLPAIQR